jgi:tetratricopeptide (TPR) repeat protein
MGVSPLIALFVLLSLPLPNGCSGPRAYRRPASGTPESTARDQNNVGVGQMNQDAFEEAAAAFRKALDFDSSFNLARVNLGIALFYHQDLDAALATLLEAEKHEPLNLHVHFCLGLVYKNHGENEKAIEHFLRVATVDPLCASNHYNLGVLYARQHKDKEAEAELWRALELDANHIPALYSLGGLLTKTGRAQEGSQLLERFRILSRKQGGKTGMGGGSRYGEMGRYALAVGSPRQP